MANEQPRNDGIPTNEDIVEDLTKDLESQLISEPENMTVNDVKTESEEDQAPSDKEEADEDKCEEQETVEEDYVDELALKDVEVTLTEEDKVKRQEDAVSLKLKGNSEHKNGQYVEAVVTYTEALRLCPLAFSGDRAILYANRAASKILVGRQKSAIDDCSKAIELNDRYVRAYLRRAKLYEDTDKLDESLEDYKKVVELDPSVADARSACTRLPPLIAERNEKMKTEMMGKLKDLGNMILKPFGLSTDNFQMNQDPNSGGYSINFNQNVNK